MRSHFRAIGQVLPIWRRTYCIQSRQLVTSVPSSSSVIPGSSFSDNELLRITPKAAEHLRSISKGNEVLRVSVDSGGCSGFEYKLALDTEIRKDDEVIEKGGVKVVVDRLSLEYIRGSKLDYVEDLMRAAFRITDNPIASQGCSCGSSFAPKSLF